jgi:hypothetical protein
VSGGRGGLDCEIRAIAINIETFLHCLKHAEYRQTEEQKEIALSGLHIFGHNDSLTSIAAGPLWGLASVIWVLM